MSTRTITRLTGYVAGLALALLASACGTANTPVADPNPAPPLTPALGSTTTTAPPQDGTADGGSSGGGDSSGSSGGDSGGSSGGQPQWPTPEDCVSYNPQNLTVVYEAGRYAVNDGGTRVLLVPGGPGEVVGDQALALAQRYRKHCYLGRTNNRDERYSYIFDYWRSPSGATPSIPDEYDACSDYDPGNLTVEDMGDGYGWRVKDHDHVLHVFDSESDARNGKLVLAKYHQICFIGSGGDDTEGQDQVSYLK